MPDLTGKACAPLAAALYLTLSPDLLDQLWLPSAWRPGAKGKAVNACQSNSVVNLENLSARGLIAILYDVSLLSLPLYYVRGVQQ